MNKLKELPNRLIEVVNATLEADENLIWFGQPQRAKKFPSGFVGIIFGLGVFFASLNPAWFLIFWIVSTIGLLECLLIYHAIGHWIPANTCYVVTNRRAIAFAPNWRGGHYVSICEPEDLAFLQCSSVVFGIGSLAWDEPIRGRFHGILGIRSCLFNKIEDPKSVLQLINEAFAPLLASRLRHDDPAIRRKAIWSILHLKPDKENVPCLIEALEDDDKIVRRCAAYALGQQEKYALPAVRSLERIVILDESRAIAETARRAIEQIEGAALPLTGDNAVVARPRASPSRNSVLAT